MPTLTQQGKNARLTGRAGTHYFWEFFMLFPAVTLGFFVENLREHYEEHPDRAKKLIETIDLLKQGYSPQ